MKTPKKTTIEINEKEYDGDRNNLELESGDYVYTKYQFGCGISKMVGPKKQDFWPKINILKGHHFILWIQWITVGQNLGMLLENKVVERLESEKKVFNEKMVPRLMKRKIQKKIHWK